MDNQTKEKIQKLIESNSVMVFMKGTKLMPQCGFSNNVVQILNSLGVEFSTFDVLSDFDMREGIKEYSDWPTIPQVYVENLKGNDHLQVTVIASEFNGLSLVKQHQLVYSALKEELASEAIHALALKTETPN